MKAVFYERKGPAREVLRVGDLPVPEPGPGEVLVRVHASGVNPSDTKTRGGWAGATAMPFPRIVPHQDGAGVIERVGEGVDAGRVGERVWIYEAQWQRPFGTGAEFVVVPAVQAVRLPETTSFAEGACLGIPAMTAHRAVFADGPVAGKTVLVTGGAGAVGHYAVQLARWGGATVIATVSGERKAEAARAAGADHVVNYRSEDVAERILDLTGGRGVDRVVEVAFAANLPVTARVMAPDGVVAAYASDTNPEPPVPFRPFMLKNVTIRFVLVYTMPRAAKDAAIGDITLLLEQRALSHRIARELPLEDAAAAHEIVERGDRIGCIVLRVGS
jgi:NADPH2:quinone reductase